MRLLRVSGLAVLLGLLSLPAAAETATVATLPSAAPQSLLPTEFAAPACPCEADLVAEQGLPAGQVGFVLFDPKTGVIIVSQNPDQAFIPASVQKIPTLLAGLEVLGPEHRFETRLLASDKIRQGAIAGDLFLEGGGDPFLTTDDVLNFVLALKDQGLTSLEGGFFFDEDALPRLTELNAGQPLAVPYNPGLSALNVNFNVVELSWARSPDTGELMGAALSRSDTLDVAAEAISFAPLPESLGKKVPFLLDRATVSTAAAGERWLLSPVLPKEGEARLPVRHPGVNAAMIFRRLAADQGIALPLPAPGEAPAESVVLKTHLSVALDKAAQLILRYSNNLSAELVGLMTTRQLGLPSGDLAGSGQALAGWLASRMPGTDWRGFVAANHSGLSAASRMTPRQAMAILAYGYGKRAEGIDLYALLAPVRWSDELNEERTAEETELAVRAKSGTIHFSRALAGYMLTDNGRMLGFAIFSGDLEARAAYDATLNVDELAEAPGARAWMKRAKALEQALVTRWAKGY